MSLPRLLISLGVFLVLTGLVWEFRDRVAVLSWLGRLPGDLNYTSGNTRVFIPITTCIVLSLLASAVSYFIRTLTK